MTTDPKLIEEVKRHRDELNLRIDLLEQGPCEWRDVDGEWHTVEYPFEVIAGALDDSNGFRLVPPKTRTVTIEVPVGLSAHPLPWLDVDGLRMLKLKGCSRDAVYTMAAAINEESES